MEEGSLLALQSHLYKTHRLKIFKIETLKSPTLRGAFLFLIPSCIQKVTLRRLLNCLLGIKIEQLF